MEKMVKFCMTPHISPPELTIWSKYQTFKNPRWRTVAILKIVECAISATVWPILVKFGTAMHIAVVLVWMIIPIFVSRSPEGLCCGNQLNLGDVRRRRAERPLLFALAFDNGLADCQVAFESFNCNNLATLYTNLVNFFPSMSEFTPLIRAILAVIWPQFDDDPHSSPCRSKTDWKTTILISAE